MASEVKRARREAPADVAPAEEFAVHEEAHRKVPKGGGFPGMIPLGAGAVAAGLAFAGVMLVGPQALPKDPYEALDAGGIQAARFLGALDIDRWKGGFASTTAVRRKIRETIEAKRTDAKGAEPADKDLFEQSVSQFQRGENGPGAKWRPGVDLIFPDNDPADAKAKQILIDAIKFVEEREPGAFQGAMVRESETDALVMHPENLPGTPPGKPIRLAAETKVYDLHFNGGPCRWYEQPMHNRAGESKGSAVVILSTASVQPISLIPAAGAAAGLAFLGGLIGASILATGPKNALRRLANDAEGVGRGILETRVHVQGPALVQSIARNLQKVALIAKSGAAAPAQVVVQEIVRAPVQEISESLAPAKSFQRPDDLECEATQKLCGDVGGDYYDFVDVDADHVGAFIADVPVRGVKSAMYMASIRALFRSNYKGKTSPAEVLKAINRGFAPDLPRGVYVTAMYAIVEKKTGLCKIANAQHLPLVFWKAAKKGSARLQPEGIALGLDPGPVFDKTVTDKVIQLEKGDRIFMSTDGAINAKNAAGAQYGEERFYYVVNREAPKNSAACVNFVANDVDLFHEGAPLLDDFTLMTIRKMR